MNNQLSVHVFVYRAATILDGVFCWLFQRVLTEWPITVDRMQKHRLYINKELFGKAECFTVDRFFNSFCNSAGFLEVWSKVTGAAVVFFTVGATSIVQRAVFESNRGLSESPPPTPRIINKTSGKQRSEEMSRRWSDPWKSSNRSFLLIDLLACWEVLQGCVCKIDVLSIHTCAHDQTGVHIIHSCIKILDFYSE